MGGSSKKCGNNSDIVDYYFGKNCGCIGRNVIIL